MYRFFQSIIFISAVGLIWISSPGAQTTPAAPVLKNEVWVHLSFKEIKSVSPVVGEATMPVNLAMKVLEAVPPKSMKECKESGFDLPQISQKIRKLKTGDKFEENSKEFLIKINKTVIPTAEQPASMLVIKNAKFPMKIPLSMTSMAIKLLQSFVKELNGMDAQLTAVLDEVKKTPPSLLLKGEDRLMQDWLEISVE